MSKALQQIWVRRCEVGYIAVVLVTSALLLTFVITAHNAQNLAKIALELPGAVFALLTPATLAFGFLPAEKLVCPPEPFLSAVRGRSPPPK